MMDERLFTPRELWKGGTVLAAILIPIFLWCIHFDRKQTEAADKQASMVQDFKDMRGVMAVMAAEAKTNHDELIQIVFYLNHQIPGGIPYTTCPPHCGAIGLRRPMPPETQAPVVGTLKGHALFPPIEPPQDVASAPNLPQISGGFDPLNAQQEGK